LPQRQGARDFHALCKTCVMLKAAHLSFSAMRTSIFTFGAVNAGIFILLAIVFKYLNMLHIWGLDMINYVVLAFLSLYQVHHWIRTGRGYVPFLQAFFAILFTGAVAFILFGAFILIYSLFDPLLAKMYITHADSAGKLVGPILLFFEGTGGSIIVALIASFYAARYEDGEVPADQEQVKH